MEYATVSSSPPPRRSLTGWAILAVSLIVCSYIFTLLLAAVCVFVPYLLVSAVAVNLTTLLLLLGGVTTAATMPWSLAPRRETFQPPGPVLDAQHQPRLFSELENIARALDEPMPGEVYLIADVNAFVAERGGKMGRGRRVLGVGLPVLQILTVSQFRAVVAHEFGHYYCGDTSLGPWVYRTRQAMHRTLVSLSSPSGAIQILGHSAVANMVRALVLAAMAWYWKLFMRATLLVSRKQEFRADELACWLAGAPALVDGLCSIAKAAAAGRFFWLTELAPALQAGYRPPVAEGFGLFMAERGIAKHAAALLDTQLKTSRTNPYDTHPPLSARIAAARSLPYQTAAEDNASAISLIDRLDALEQELLEARIPQIKKTALKAVPWDNVGVQVYIPVWRSFVVEYNALIADLTAQALPDAVKNLRALGSRMRDPKGMLLTHEQRAGRAKALLWMALAIALIDSGWELHARPGESHVERHGVQLKPLFVIAELQSGKLTADDWRAQCTGLGIADLRLGAASA